MVRKFTLLTLFSLLALTSTADGDGRTVRGIITDAGTGEPVAGAVVVVTGTYIGTSTDGQGTFLLDKVPSGSRLHISCVSFRDAELDVDALGPDHYAQISLEGQNLRMNTVTVSSRRRQNTENAMVAAVRNLPHVASGISASQIAKSPDRQASDVVRRIPGITIMDDRFIIVRGLSQRYNNAWINGLAVPSTEADSRAFSFDIIPSSQIDNIIVFKSSAPEIPGDFAGGFVKLTTKTTPDANITEIGYTTGFNVNTQFRSFLYNPGSRTDFLGFDLNKRPLGNKIPSHLDNITDAGLLTDITKNGFNNDWRVKTRTALPDQRISFAMARRIEGRSGLLAGNVTSINYSNTNKTVVGIANSRYGIYSAAADAPVVLEGYNDDQYTNDVRLGAMHNWSLEINPHHILEFKNILNIHGRNRLTLREGIKNISSMYYLDETEMLYSSRLTYSGQLSGRHDLGRGGKIDWNGGYSYASRNEPDRRIVSNLAGVSTGVLEEVGQVTTSNDYIKRYYQTLHDNIYSGAADYSRSFGNGLRNITLKAGAYAEYRDRSYDPREFVYRYQNLSYDERPGYLRLPFEMMLANHWMGADKVYIDEITSKTNAYSATVNQQAYYAAVEFPVGPVNIYAGLRTENYVMRLTRDKSNSPQQQLVETKRHSSLDILPSANITYKINERHQIRAAYGRSLNRPELREVSPAVYYDFDLFSEIGGNEDLRTAYIHNADLRYEFYPSHGEVISVGVFYKHFKNPIEWTYIDMGGSLRYSYENARSARNMGIEVDIRKNLDFLRMPDLSLVLNAAWIDSNIKFSDDQLLTRPDRPMQGQSPYVINAGLFYFNDRLGLEATVLYNRIGRRIVGIGKTNSVNNDINSMIPDSYEMPRNAIDISVSKRFGDLAVLRLTVNDLLSENIVYKQFPRFADSNGRVHKRQQVTKSYNPGQSVTVGVNFRF